jgi:hypothetical protein
MTVPIRWPSDVNAPPLAKRVDERVLGALPAAQLERFVDVLRAIVKALDGEGGRRR